MIRGMFFILLVSILVFVSVKEIDSLGLKVTGNVLGAEATGGVEVTGSQLSNLQIDLPVKVELNPSESSLNKLANKN